MKEYEVGRIVFNNYSQEERVRNQLNNRDGVVTGEAIPTNNKRNPKSVTDYWAAYYFTSEHHGLCTLCGNTGKIDTRTTAISPRGYNVGRINFCICPNGQAMRKADVKLTLKLQGGLP